MKQNVLKFQLAIEIYNIYETKFNYPRLTRLRHSTKFIRQIKITSS